MLLGDLEAALRVAVAHLDPVEAEYAGQMADLPGVEGGGGSGGFTHALRTRTLRENACPVFLRMLAATVR
jgi:hypothetical protein